MRSVILVSIALILVVCAFGSADAKNPIRSDFFNYYPSVDGTVLSSRSDGSNHCGMCHFDFNGGGPRNHFGGRLEGEKSLDFVVEQQESTASPRSSTRRRRTPTRRPSPASIPATRDRS